MDYSFSCGPHYSYFKHKPLSDSSYTKLPKELDHPKEGLINIQNIIDNECFKWCLIRYLHPADHHSARIRNFDKMFESELYFNDTKFPVKIRDVHKICKKELYRH